MSDVTQDDLFKELEETNKLLKRYTSLSMVFIRGILSGCAGFLGATIVIAILFATLSRLSVVPFIGEFIVQLLEFIEANQPYMN